MELLGLLFVLVLVTVVGHGIWIAVAAFVRLFTKNGSNRPTPQRRDRPRPERCPACDARLSELEHACAVCGLDRAGWRANQIRELSISLRQVWDLIDRAEIDQKTSQLIVDLLERRRRSLRGEPDRRPTPAVPSAPSPHPIETVAVPSMLRVPAAPSEEILDALPVEPLVLPDVTPIRHGSDAPSFQPQPVPALPTMPAEVPATSRRRLADVLSAFMEERNILWGELVGGLLIVGCSIALVLTLWRNLQDLPYFPFLMFSVLTGALFAAGQYTLHHWKLQSSSRGLLLIAMLLVPLNLLVLADPTARGTTPKNPWVDLAVGIAAVVAFTLVVRASGRDLIGTDVLPGPIDRRWLLAIAVVGAAGSQLLTPHLLDAPETGLPARLLPLALVPGMFHLLACAAVLGGLTLYGGRRPLHVGQVHALFAFLGLATFALLASFGFLLSRLIDPFAGLHVFACPIILSGIPALSAGLVVFRRLEGENSAGPRTTGTGVALAGAGLMIAGVVLAWPAPLPLLTALLLVGSVLTLAAFAARVPWGHVGAIPCLVLAGLVGFYIADGRLLAENQSSQTLLTLFVSADSAALLIGVAAILVLLGAGLSIAKLADHALVLEQAAVAIGGIALLIATGNGPDHPLIAAGVHFAAYLVGGFLCIRWRSAALAHVAVALLIPSTLWALSDLYPKQYDLWAVILASETLAMVSLSCLRFAPGADPKAWFAPLATAAERVGLLVGALALFIAIAPSGLHHDAAHTWTAGILSLALLVEALQRRSQGWFVAFQAGLLLTVVSAVTTIVQPLGWLADARGLQAYGVGLALLSLAWIAARRAMAHRPALEELLPRTWIGLDRLTLVVLVVGVMVGSVIAAGAGVIAEWAPDSSTEVMGHLFGPGTWLLLGVLTVALVAMLIGPPNEKEIQLRKFAVVGLLALTLSATSWWAATHIVDRAGASALRWGLAGCFLVGSVLLALRHNVGQLAERIRLARTNSVHDVRAVLGATACVVVFLTIILTGLGFSGEPLPGPLPESIFAQMGSVVCGIGPMILVIAALVGTAFRDRSPGYALAAGLLTTATAMGGYALATVQSGITFAETHAILTVLIGCGVAGTFALAWLAFVSRMSETTVGTPLAIQSWLGLAGAVTLAVLMLPRLLSGPGLPPEAFYAILGGSAGWVALLLSAASAFWYMTIAAPRRRVHVAALALLAAGILAGSLARAWDGPAVWVSYHVLAGFWSALAIAISVAGSQAPLRSRRWQVMLPARLVRPWLAGLAVLLALVAVRGAFNSLAHYGTPIAAALAASILMGSVALWFRHGGFAHPSGLLFALASFLTWIAWGPSTFAAGWLSIVIGLAVAAGFWQAIALPQLRIDVANLRWPGTTFSPIAATAALGLLFVIVSVALGIDALGKGTVSLGAMGWSAAVAVGVAFLAAAANEKSRVALPGLYALDLVLAGLVLHALGLPPSQLPWAGALALAVHASVVGLFAWALRAAKATPDAASWLKLPMMEREWPWLLPAQATVAVVVALLGFGVALSFAVLQERLMGPLAIMLLAPAALVLAQVAPAQWPGRLRLASAAAAAAALAALAWAVPDPSGVAPWLERNAWLLGALTLSTLVALQASTRWTKETDAMRLRQFGLVMGWMAVLLAPLAIGQMFPVFDTAALRTPLSGLGVACVVVSLFALIFQALQLAVRPEGDPMNLSERGRTAYVYLAEVLVVLLFLHCRLNVPELFLGFLVRYWTLVVLLIAFLGVGLSELCERNNLRVLAGPLQRTGIFLPLLPLLSFWVKPSGTVLAFAADHAPGLLPLLSFREKVPSTFDSYALLWFLSAVLYAVVAMARRSTGWAIAAALAVNFGLWSLLMHAGVGFLVHPQAWIIPLGLIVLASEFINHDRLSREASQALRYLGISLIYVASTADLFMTGLGNSLWLPVVLAVLCVAGVLAGILMRVRAFLFLGVGFLLVDLLAMIWHAAVDRSHTWLWWVCGIVLGAAILALFAVFEKRRNDVLELLDRFRAWE